MRFQLKKLLLGLALIAPSLVLADSLQFWPQTGKDVGDYAAGAGAIEKDVAAAYYNPAAMTYTTHQEIGFSGISEFNSTKFNGQVTASPLSSFTNNSGTVQGGQYLFMPSIMYVAPISNQWAFGLSISSPYKNYVRYGNSAFTRYDVIQNNFNTYDIAPSLAFKPMPKLSFGLGMDALYAEEYFSRMVTTTSPANDTFSKNRANNWGFGFHTGMFWQATSTTNIGLSYRSSIKVNATGSSKLIGPVGNRDTRVKYSLTLPPMTILSGQQMLNKKLALLGSIVYTQWGQLHNFQLNNVATSTGTTSVSIASHLHNTWRFILGSRYQMSDKWGAMGALGYEQGSTSKAHRNIILPDAGSVILSLGLQYQIATNFSAAAGYTHLFTHSAGINQTQASEGVTYDTIGNIYNNSDIIGLELDWKMT
ncbi:MAG: hypothetical protein A3E87_06820 [Gammaproteobacteria bacterium RIFCSPHIGHO2_12_FULL_35_23]|nr:MAG: hypothetical protein A3E87_06820 [Gammaproteobacteria bacterium RIFCSPHIGHO2_12_FULL_35_23]